ncbi:MAG TPA: hypothetical protein PKM48_08775, partial [Parvularculaceae bacterium]|nr:hypothetical protein [Parvularculaceae bacterium]
FGARKVYDFLVLTLETRHFNEAALTPLFDEEPDFARLLRVLDKAGARRAVATATQSGAALPAPIREQLAKYSVRDNIVIRGENDTQIMKIVAVRDDATDAADWPALARRMLLEQGAGARAEKLVTRLKKDADIAYFRASAAPPPAAKAE